MATYVEELIRKACQVNSVVIGTKACETVSITGPLRLAERDPEKAIALAVTSLVGQSAKEIKKTVVPAVPADFTVVLTAANKYTAVLVRVAGSKNNFKQGDVLLTLSGTGMSPTKVALCPNSNRVEAFVLLTNDNGGVGQISAPSAIIATWLVADHPEAAGLEYVVALEGISLRDFSNRGQG